MDQYAEELVENKFARFLAHGVHVTCKQNARHRHVHSCGVGEPNADPMLPTACNTAAEISRTMH